MRTRPNSPARIIRRSGLRVSMGSWTAYVASSADPHSRLIVSLGRSAGGSVARSRVRRVARDVFRPLRDKRLGLDLLLVARDDIRNQSRRYIRSTLQKLMTRGTDALKRRLPVQDDLGG